MNPNESRWIVSLRYTGFIFGSIIAALLLYALSLGPVVRFYSYKQKAGDEVPNFVRRFYEPLVQLSLHWMPYKDYVNWWKPASR
jgi:hypothetical protein